MLLLSKERFIDWNRSGAPCQDLNLEKAVDSMMTLEQKFPIMIGIFYNIHIYINYGRKNEKQA